MFNHKYKTFNADNLKNSAHRTTCVQRLNDGRNKMARGGDERAKQATKFGNAFIIENRRKSEATKLGSGESRGIAVFNFRHTLKQIGICV